MQQIIDTAQADYQDGRPFPPEVTEFVNALLYPYPTSARGHQIDGPDSVEITSAEMARRTGYSIRHVRRLCQAGRLKARRDGRDWLISTEVPAVDEDDASAHAR